MIHIGIDDTDSLAGMCTTFLAAELAHELVARGFDLIGPPRLVRLNPMIKLKTRGNAALSLRVGRGAGPTAWCGRWKGTDLWCHPGESHSRPANGRINEVEEVVRVLIDRRADVANGANPGYVVTARPPSPDLYRLAVTDFVPLDAAIESLPKGARHGGNNGSLGIVGAAAAVAWPARRSTWEIIAYREKPRWGTPREVDAESVIAMSRRYPETFNSYDGENERVLVTPRSPCPVLFGIRAVRPGSLLWAARSLRTGERWDTCILYQTNQATGDHLVDRSLEDIAPGISVRAAGRVSGRPRNLKGGHVVFEMRGPDHGRIDCAAYEPTRRFRRAVRALRPGDRVVVWGGVRDEPRSVNLERMDILTLAGDELRNPRCPACERSMESAGRGQGYRCRKCGSKAARRVRKPVERSISPGSYEVARCAMRHLHRPIDLGDA